MTEAQARARGVQLSLNGDITPELEQTFVADLARLEKQGAPRVELFINSGGGSVLAGLGLYSALARYTGGIDTRVDGVAASMAGVLFLVGERRLISRSGWLMLHSPFLNAEGNASVLRETAATLDRLGASLTEIVASRTGQPDETVAAWLSQELRDGLATEVVTSGAQGGPRLNPAKHVSRCSCRVGCGRCEPEGELEDDDDRRSGRRGNRRRL